MSVNVVSAPLPGKIMDIKVSVGDNVKRGQVLVILEAMKMENEIVSSFDGTVDQIAVQKGESVNFGATLLTLA